LGGVVVRGAEEVQAVRVSGVGMVVVLMVHPGEGSQQERRTKIKMTRSKKSPAL